MNNFRKNKLDTVFKTKKNYNLQAKKSFLFFLYTWEFKKKKKDVRKRDENS